MKENKREEEDKEIGMLINKLFQSWGVQGKIKEFEVVQAWPEMMGLGVANRTENLYIQNKVLHVKLNSSVMRDELQFGKNIIIARVNEYAGFEIITDVWFS